MYIRDLRGQLQKWRDRLYNAEPIQLSQQLDSFITALKAEAYINSILVELDAEAETLEPNPMQRISNAMNSDMGGLGYLRMKGSRTINSGLSTTTTF